MSARNLLILFVLSIAGYTQAQTMRTIRLNVLFDSDKYELKKKEKDKIINYFDTLDTEKIKAINLVGHADSRGDSLYNIRLSNNRMNEVDKFLRSIGIVEQVSQKKGIGENKPVADNASDQGMQKNRRVEILIKYMIKPAVVNRKDTLPAKKEPVDTCKKDSVFQPVGGILLNVDECHQQTLKNCVEIETIGTAEELRRSGLNMRDARGNGLISDGMFRLKWKSACGPACNNFRMKWLIPEAEFGKSAFNFYAYDRNSWSNFARKSIKKVTIDGLKYYCVELDCSMFGRFLNKDKPYIPSVQKVKVPKRWRIVSMQSDSGSKYFFYTRYDTTETFDRKNVFKATIIARSTIHITNRKNDTLAIHINDLKARRLKFFRTRWPRTYGDGKTGWPHNGFPHIATVKHKKVSRDTKDIFPFKKYKLKRRAIRKKMRELKQVETSIYR